MTRQYSLVKVCKLKLLLKKASNINHETISSNRFSIAQNKNELNLVKEKLTATPSDTSTKKNIENFQNCGNASDDVKNQYKKSSLSLEGQQQQQEEMKKANLDRQLKEIF